jgi:DNA invertase Pin-like site-specific DNA recombinase
MNTRPATAHRLAALYLTGAADVPARRAALERLAQAKGWPRTETLHDTEGHRPELRRLQGSIMAGGVQAVIVGDVAELGRGVVEIIETLAWLDAQGVALYALTPPIDSHRVGGRMALALAARLAEFHSGVRRERLEAGKPGRSGGARKRPAK